MKKIKLFLLLMMLCAGLGARAQELIDGIAYYLDVVHYTATVTQLPDPDKYVGDIVVPEQVNYDGHDYAVTAVGPYAFLECTELTSVTLPATITEIVNYAFFGCSALTSVNIPEGITIINENTFSDCSSLTSITLPESLTEIGYGAFLYCGLESITLPANVASIGGDAFMENRSLQTIHVQRTTPPTLGTDAFYYIPSDHVIYVPAESVDLYKAADGWKELNIKAEGAGSNEIYAALSGSTMTIYFDDQKASRPGVLMDWTMERGTRDVPDGTRETITNAVINPSMVDARPTKTFYWFWDLTYLTTIDGLANLNTSEVTTMSSMFQSCSLLTKLDLSGFNTDKVTSMSYMFKGCSSLTSLDVSNFNTDNVTSMSYMFQFCSSLKTIYCDDDWSASSVLEASDYMFNGCTALVGGKGTKYDAGVTDKTYARPDGLDDLPGYFTVKGAGSKEIYATLSGSTMTIYFDDQKASHSDLLDKWTPESGVDMASATRNLITKAVIDASMVDARPTGTKWWFFGLANLTTIDGLANLNTSEVTYMEAMFMQCTSLTSLDVSNFNTDKVTSMKYMFSGCSSLTTIYCNDAWNPSSSNDMFGGCTALVGGKGTKYDAGKKDATYARPDGLDDQPGYFTSTPYTGEALIDGIRYYLSGDDMTAEVMPLGDGYYAGDIVLPEKVSYMKNDYAVTSVAGAAFSNCPELLTVTIPKSVNWIEPEVFYNSPKLTAVNVAAANANYSSFDGVLFNKAQTELRAYPTAKEGAYIVPEGVETIMDATFAENKKLTAVTLPASLYEIASRAFENCTGLEMITSRASAVPSLGSDVFVGVNKAIPVFVPKANIALYRAEFGWEDFTNYIAIEDKEAADAVIAKINAIGTVTYTPECKARIDAARGGYDALTAEQKVYITDATYKILTDAEKTYADLKAKAEADQAAASAVIGKIDAIGTVTLESEAAILDARSAYNALTAAQQALVTNYSVLTAAEAKLEILKKQAESDEAAAKAVTDLINAIGTVTYTSESKARIDAAREAYDALTAAQKALVTNLTTLTAAEKAYADLKAKAEADQAAANIVIGKINAIGTVTYTPESKALIDAAREAYDALTDAQKGLVSAALMGKMKLITSKKAQAG